MILIIFYFCRLVFITIKHIWLILIVITEWVMIKNIIIKFRTVVWSISIYLNEVCYIRTLTLFKFFFLVQLKMRKKQRFFRIIRDQMISMCVKSSSFLCQKFISGFCRLVNNFEGTITEWFQFIRKLNICKFSVSRNWIQRFWFFKVRWILQGFRKNYCFFFQCVLILLIKLEVFLFRKKEAQQIVVLS